MFVKIIFLFIVSRSILKTYLFNSSANYSLSVIIYAIPSYFCIYSEYKLILLKIKKIYSLEYSIK